MEGSPDHIGEEVSENDNTEAEPGVATVAKTSNEVLPAAYHQPESEASNQAADGSNASAATPSPQQNPPKTGTVVLDADSAMTVPSFIGKSVRTVIEESERAGLEVDVFGSGVAKQQNPPPGSRIPAGGHVTVQFAR